LRTTIRRLGIPRGLLYHKRRELWEEFFDALGVETVISPPTTRSIIDRGCALSIDETCLSVKIMIGHVAWLAEECDAILCPRYASVRRDEQECSKLWGVYDIAANSVPGIQLVDYSVDAGKQTHGRTTEAGELYRLARRLGATPAAAAKATARAVRADRRAHDRHVRETERVRATRSPHPRVLIAAHSYNLHDEAIGLPIVRALESHGCQVVDSDGVARETATKLAKKVSPTLYWTNSLQLLGAVEHWREHVDGIVFIVTFPCGPDSLVTELATRKFKDVPIMTLVVDEHSGETGLQTRLESFVDILRMRRGEPPVPTDAEDPDPEEAIL
jgi:predicted nucleotide-binding protein (sugar kinase/HSP70/actin superfamily)